MRAKNAIAKIVESVLEKEEEPLSGSFGQYAAGDEIGHSRSRLGFWIRGVSQCRESSRLV
jgi:hypothetical protein